MSVGELMLELHKLSQTEKLILVQFLVNEIAAEQQDLQFQNYYEVWTPYDTPDAVDILQRALDADERARRANGD